MASPLLMGKTGLPESGWWGSCVEMTALRGVVTFAQWHAVQHHQRGAYPQRHAPPSFSLPTQPEAGEQGSHGGPPHSAASSKKRSQELGISPPWLCEPS